MKKEVLFLITFFAAGTFLLKGQPAGSWSTPVAFTDSSSYNYNPDMAWGTPVIFYEKKQNQQSPQAIYMVNLYSNCGETEVLGDNAVSYRNPKTIVSNSEQAKYLIYESDESGNFDLYAISFDGDCNFGTPLRLTFTDEDESSVSVINLNPNKIAFIRGNTLVAGILHFTQDTLYLSDIHVIDIMTVSNPVITNSYLFWQRLESGEYHIYRSQTSEWTSPEPIFTNGNNTDLKPMKSDFFAPYGVSWENEGHPLYFIYEPDFPDTLIVPGIDTVFQYAPFKYTVGRSNMWETGTFTTGYGQNQEIYYLDNSFFQEVVNISKNNRKDSNSDLFVGTIYNELNIYKWYCLWESEINGYSALYYSERDVDITGDVEENNLNPLAVMSPNPFKNKLKIEILKPEIPAMIEIYDLSGKRLFMWELKNKETTIWNPAKQNPELNGGIYIVKVTQGGKSTSMKVVYVND